LRKAGIKSINIDALYGLPLQDEARLAMTLEKVVSLAPDRIALFGYAHVPWLKTHQRMINDKDLPDTKARIRQAMLGRQLLLARGYGQIGIDHFALPGDALSAARASGKLMRNFQGYTTDTATVRIGLGASAIGAFPEGLVQNEVAAGAYARSVHNGLLPLARGVEFTPDDQIRSYVISGLMCNFEISFADLEARFGSLAAPLIAEARAIAAGEARRLCAADSTKLRVLGDAPLFARIVASKFDAHLKTAEKRYSKAV
jgi:oxygen-independent coproporphyrinogen-3 oxidase